MKTAQEWIPVLNDNAQSWTKTIHEIQSDALLEAAEIAARHIGQRSSDGRKILDAILARAEELNDRPHPQEG